jgi:hypothetical protein
LYVALPEAVPVPATPPFCADALVIVADPDGSAYEATRPADVKTVYVSSASTRPATSVGVTVIVAASPGAYEALSSVTITPSSAAVPPATRTATAAADTVAAVAALPTVKLAVPALRPVKPNVTTPAADDAAAAPEALTTVRSDEVMYRVGAVIVVPAASFATAVMTPVSARTPMIGLTTVATIDATAPKNVTVSVPITTPAAVRISTFATPDVPSGKTPTTWLCWTAIARPTPAKVVPAAAAPEPESQSRQGVIKRDG